MSKLISIKPYPKGSAEFESERKKIVDDVLKKLPQDLILPDEIFENPPQNVINFPRESGLLTKEELEITENYDLVGLAEAIASRRLSSVAVTRAFCRRAAIAHQLTFCLTEFYMSEALSQAEHLDLHLATTGKPLGPLHGIPISIKEMIPVKNQLSSLGLKVTRQVNTEDCVTTQILRELGAVFYVKTHQPAAVLSAESTSFLGRTLNPHNLNLAPGGSSGGEGALLAMRGSVFGFGTDIGGSVRIPASFCGVYGFKGSDGFVPTEKLLSGPFPAGMFVPGVVGPLGRSLRDVDFVMRCVREVRPWLRDQEVLPTVYRGLKGVEGLRKETMKVGLLQDYGAVQPQPPVREAMEWVHKQLTSNRFKVLSYTFPEPQKAHKLYSELLSTDGWTAIRGALQAGKEPTFPVFEEVIKQLIAESPGAAEGKESSASRIADLKWQRDVLRAEFLADWIAQGDPDIVIAPMSPAAPHDTADLVRSVSGTHYWNLVDYPAFVVPTPFHVMSKASYNSEEYEDVRPRSKEDIDTKEIWRKHDMEGAPICLQIIAKRRMESELIAAVGLIQQALCLP
ncbi:acyl-ester intermediate acetamidase [Pseudocercospora fijiensis CIRAD86]|uniref:amidase n=1 Tax=Pseudocercospora fijiensis (strain CIRAD86) TaxID=383855 RepID=M2ZAY9_PSEFD|nr:acyl-ester intermediate acetamidase [Pseudocercospora fijiensis CIRAD86]EME87010.1 acyl-ester intermediate acetamidase [Pseudocercospora fijiensis CIRAD86]